MPAGLSYPRYITYFTASLLTALAGAQTVHKFYRPLDDLNDLVEEELARRKYSNKRKV
ncbi:uncharacterized protein C12orf73 [Belonocnema kinseyi]|uniref:uncharacterized protein C12orf73 n=1 Tax=Belonocnema kinseyi TaxID=2817044 RepID=UPI00143CCD2A|nr:uncharacterized protein C12orf73 [Belonocnema kinseyi]